MALFTWRRGATAAALLLCALPAQAWAQAWPVTHRWHEKARPGDPTSGSYAYEYARESVAAAASMTAANTKLDCADMAITILCEYAAKNGLEVVWTMPDPANNGAVGRVSSSDGRFTSAPRFAKWSRDWINARMVATLNTSPVTHDEARSGDMYLMKWSQLGANDPFPGRDVWHTFLCGEPGALIFYGNISDGTPLPITATATRGRLDEVRTSAAVYGASPRRWKLFDGNVIPPSSPLLDAPSILARKEATVNADALNVRALPSTHSQVVGKLRRGERVAFEGRTADGWVRVRRADGSIAYVSSQFVSIVDAPRGFHVQEDWVPPPVTATTTTGFMGALGTDEP
jgi:hypothetical protein